MRRVKLPVQLSNVCGPRMGRELFSCCKSQNQSATGWVVRMDIVFHVTKQIVELNRVGIWG